MKLLIIGGTGVLSSAVVAEALSRKIDVTIVTRGKKKRDVIDGVTQIKADYRDRDLMVSKLAGLHYDAVIDFICYTKKQIEYSINLLSGVADQYIFISTACVYNTRIPGIKSEESEKVLPEWDYSVNKWECECFLKEQASRLNFNYSIVRPCITYDDTRIPYGIMPLYGYHWTLCSRILYGKPVLRWDGGNVRWNMMRVEDFAVGVVGIIGNRKCYSEAFNISGDTPYTWNDVLTTLGELLGREPIVFDLTSEEYKACYPDRNGEIVGRSLDLVVSNKKIKEYVPEYTTTYSLKEGLRKTINAYKENNYQLGIDWRYDAATDRIVKTISRKRGKSSDSYNLSFIDYIGTATRADKRIYWMEFHRFNVFVLGYSLFIRLINKMQRILSR